jgi:hypothetical protein
VRGKILMALEARHRRGWRGEKLEIATAKFIDRFSHLIIIINLLNEIISSSILSIRTPPPSLSAQTGELFYRLG